MPSSYSILKSDSQAAGFAHVLAHSYARSEEEAAKWIAGHDRANIRILEDGNRVQAGLILIPMGQFFGGRSVPMVGVGAVGVAPEARGRGTASEIMRQTLRELRSKSVPTSTLYPATQALYRRVGYEQAGHRCEVRLPLARIPTTERSLHVRPLEDKDKPVVRALYTRAAAAGDGPLDRNETIWKRIEFPPPSRVDPARAFVILGDSGAIEAYVFLSQFVAPSPTGGGKYEVHIHDMAAATAAAGRRLWSFLGSYATVGTDLVWYTGAHHPLLALLDEQPYTVTLKHYWMLRIVDVPAALRARGYPHGLRAEIHLDIRDDLIPENNGPIILEIGGEAATVHRGGRADLRLDIGALASLYAGFMSPDQLALIGRASGTDSAIKSAAAAFAPRGSPGMTDMF